MSVSADTLIIKGTSNDGVGAHVGCGVDSVYISFDGGGSWSSTINTGTDFSAWQYYWTGYESQNYTIKSKAIDKLGNEEIPSEGYIVTDIEDLIQAALPKNFDLAQNYPNPFNPETSISFQLPRPEKVEIIVFNQVGQVIRHLIEGEMHAGHHKVVWDARNDNGEAVTSGLYLCQMIAGSYKETIKMLLMK